jgi:hypothetical protein
MGSDRGKGGLAQREKKEDGGWRVFFDSFFRTVAKVLFAGELLLRKSMIYEQGIGRTV